MDKIAAATKLEYKQNSPIEGMLEVKISGGYVVERMEEAYDRLKGSVEVKGFRKGKVPLHIVKQKLRLSVIRDTFEALVSETVRVASVEKQIPLVGEPRVNRTNWLSWKEGDDMEYTAQLELLPQVELKKYKGLSIEVDDFEVTDRKVEDAIRNVLESRAELVPVENRGVRDRDVLILDFEGWLGDRKLPEANAENFVLEMGGPNTMRDFQDGILGMKPGENREVKVDYPKDYNNAEIAGKTITYKVKLHEIKAKNYPELSDEIAKEFKAESAADLRAKVRSSIEAQGKFDERQQREERALAALVEANSFQVPTTLVQYQLNNILKELSSLLERQKFSSKLIEEYVNRHIEELHLRAEREVKLALLLPRVVEIEKIVASDEDVSQRIELMAQSSDKEADAKRIRAAYATKEARASLKSQIARDKALELIVSSAKFKVKSA